MHNELVENIVYLWVIPSCYFGLFVWLIYQHTRPTIDKWEKIAIVIMVVVWPIVLFGTLKYFLLVIENNNNKSKRENEDDKTGHTKTP